MTIAIHDRVRITSKAAGIWRGHTGRITGYCGERTTAPWNVTIDSDPHPIIALSVGDMECIEDDVALTYEFVECDTCRAKPGTPTLCQGCLANRTTIHRMQAQARWRDAYTTLSFATRLLSLYQEANANNPGVPEIDNAHWIHATARMLRKLGRLVDETPSIAQPAPNGSVRLNLDAIIAGCRAATAYAPGDPPGDGSPRRVAIVAEALEALASYAKELRIGILLPSVGLGPDPLRRYAMLGPAVSGPSAADVEGSTIRPAESDRHRVELTRAECIIANACHALAPFDRPYDRGTPSERLEELAARAARAHDHLRRNIEQASERLRVTPVPMRLICEGCGELHIDEGEFATKPHHTHSCQHCGLTWRPAIGPTVGVRFLPGFRQIATSTSTGTPAVAGVVGSIQTTTKP